MVGGGNGRPGHLGKDRGCDPTPFRLTAGVAVRPEAYGDDGPSWVVARAEAELVERYGQLDESESGLTGAMFEPPAGVFLVARAAGRPSPGRRGGRAQRRTRRAPAR